jgi:phosphate/phosphite/phosphonate ABC transporter binding protein
MGEVYLANSLGVAGFEKLVTVKILRRKVSDNPDRVRDLMREAFIGVRLDHENIVQVLDLGEHDGTYFLVMEYVRGFSLREVIAFASANDERLPIRPVAHAIRCIADALDYVHRVRGPHRKPLELIHRDVSPSNILLGAEGRIKLSDFGVAVVARDTARAGQVIGKPRYLPPEAAALESATQGWDVYALAAVLHAALTGDPDFERSGRVAAIGPRLRPVEEVRADCPPALRQLVVDATAREPSTRVRTAAELRARLDEAVPREVDDAEVWRTFLQPLYRRDAFVARYGNLPYIEELVPELQPAATEPSPVAYVETVVVDSARPLRFGMSPALGVDAARRTGERVAAWLRSRVDRDVRSAVLPDYQALVDALVDGEIDFAWMPPAAFVAAADRGAGVVALAQRYGRSTYESAIIVRDTSPITRLADLAGTSIAYVDRNSASGYLYAVDLVTRELGRPAGVFREEHFQGSHRAVCDAVLHGWVDAGTTYVVRDDADNIVHSGWLDLSGPDAARLRVVASSAPIPCDNLAHRPGLAAGIVDRVARTIVDVAADDADGRAILKEVFHADGMIRADLRLYDSVRETLARAARATAPAA